MKTTSRKRSPEVSATQAYGCVLLLILSIIAVIAYTGEYGETRQQKVLQREGLTKKQITDKSREQLREGLQSYFELTKDERRYLKLTFAASHKLRKITIDETVWMSTFLSQTKYSDATYKKLMRRYKDIQPFLLHEWTAGNTW